MAKVNKMVSIDPVIAEAINADPGMNASAHVNAYFQQYYFSGPRPDVPLKEKRQHMLKEVRLTQQRLAQQEALLQLLEQQQQEEDQEDQEKQRQQAEELFLFDRSHNPLS